MAHTGIFATSGATIFKAGVSHSDISEENMNQLHKDAESEINLLTRKNWSDAYATLNVDVQGVLSQASANLTGMYHIAHDMSGYTSRSEAQTMLDVLYQKFVDLVKILRDKKTESFMDNA
jgi:hypothetical protein